MASASGSEFILIVDDDPRLCRLLRRYLTSESYEVETVHDGQQMKRALDDQSFDLIILDLNLPYGEDGFSLASYLRATWDVPIIMLTGRSDCVDKVAGLELGADDYITKPFERRELIARIRSVLRRSNIRSAASETAYGTPKIIRFSGWALDLTRHELISPANENVELTSYEYQLLSFLVQRAGRVISRDEILDSLANRDWQPYDRSIDVLISKLRRKLNDDARSPRIIKTIRGDGYMFLVATRTRPKATQIADLDRVASLVHDNT